jgi:4-carboxymuconolactone decarboxylase
MRSVVICSILVLLCAATPARAQDRMPPIPADKLTEAQRKAIEEFRAARSAEISGPFVPLLRSPEVLTRARALSDYLRYRSALPPRLSEFVILMTARAWTQNYEWNAHEPLARRAGLSDGVIKAIADGRRPDGMAEDEEILFTFCDELRRTQAVSDPLYARAVAKFGEQGVIDTVGLVGYYTLIAMVLNTARTPLPPGASAALTPLPR